MGAWERYIEREGERGEHGREIEGEREGCMGERYRERGERGRGSWERERESERRRGAWERDRVVCSGPAPSRPMIFVPERVMRMTNRNSIALLQTKHEHTNVNSAWPNHLHICITRSAYGNKSNIIDAFQIVRHQRLRDTEFVNRQIRWRYEMRKPFVGAGLSHS